MRAEVGDAPWTEIVTPVEPDSASALAICELLSVSRTTPPVSTLSAEQGASVAKATANASAVGTSMPCTTARHRPGGPLTWLLAADVPLRDACSVPFGSMSERVMKLPG